MKFGAADYLLAICYFLGLAVASSRFFALLALLLLLTHAILILFPECVLLITARDTRIRRHLLVQSEVHTMQAFSGHLKYKIILVLDTQLANLHL